MERQSDLFVPAGSAIASYWSAERCRKAFGAGDYRAGWYLFDDDAVELDDPMGWEPLTHEIDRVDNEIALLLPNLEHVLP